MKLNHPTPMRRRKGGFTLAELMVVIVIIGLLSTVVVPKLFDKFGKAQIATTKANIKTMENAILEFRMANMRLPDSLEDLVTEDDKGTTYLDTEVVPKDGWGNEFVYEVDNNGEPVIWCLGADGEQGGEGQDADFSNVTMKNQQ